MDYKTVKGILIRYDIDGYRIWFPERNLSSRSRAVVFDEKPKYSECEPVNLNLPEHDMASDPVEELQENQNKAGENELDLDIKVQDKFDKIPEDTIILNNKVSLRDRSKLERPEKYNDFVMYNNIVLSDHVVLSTYAEAMQSEDSSVFIVESNPDGTVDRFKARLIAKGFKEKKGVDSEHTFCPVTKLSTVRTSISICAREKMVLKRFDT
ncbi:hypothetical protein ILUMI_18792 [Ignelater luminosus]|uniref:Retroviral polymerase SH3-like domain-containing protein n=1 Tax=Ignelater luminosus TaxID=2038154 RepID=A0A8K0CLT6_IGNLU|nr:hypothetical protein ILUMI_18792 [Ignelater luminosus]